MEYMLSLTLLKSLITTSMLKSSVLHPLHCKLLSDLIFKCFVCISFSECIRMETKVNNNKQIQINDMVCKLIFLCDYLIAVGTQLQSGNMTITYSSLKEILIGKPR